MIEPIYVAIAEGDFNIPLTETGVDEIVFVASQVEHFLSLDEAKKFVKEQREREQQESKETVYRPFKIYKLSIELEAEYGLSK